MTPEQGTMIADTHVFPVRVYFEDTDAGGVVYYANYLRFAERARTEFLRVAGASHATLMEQDSLVFAVRRCEVEYLKPARLDDALEIHTSGLILEAASLWLDQVVQRGRDVLVTIRVRLACLNGEGRPARLPRQFRAALETFLKNNNQVQER